MDTYLYSYADHMENGGGCLPGINCDLLQEKGTFPTKIRLRVRLISG